MTHQQKIVWISAVIILAIGLRMSATRSSSLKFRTLREMKPQTSLTRWQPEAEPTSAPSIIRSPTAPVVWRGQGDFTGSVNDGKFTITINDTEWFSPGTAQMTSKGLLEAGRFSALLKKLPVDWSKASVQVEGHSDSAPVVRHRDTYPTNWELSGSRAFTLVRLLELHGFPRERLAGIGYADSRTKNSLATNSGRRLTVSVSVESPPQARLEVAQH